MHDASKIAKEKLAAASRSKDTSRRLALSLAIASVGMLLILVVALLDYWFMLPMLLRLTAMAGLGALMVWGLAKLWKTWRKPTHLKEAALDAEAQRPDLGCELSTAAEYLSGERKATQAYEPELVAALQAKAAKNLECVELPYWKRPLRPALLLAIVTVAFLLFGVLASGAFTAFKRTAVPWSNASYTQVQVKPGDVEIPIGRDVDIKSVFSGRTPKDALLQWQDEKSPQWQNVSLTRDDQGQYNYPIKNVRTSLKYRVRGSDAVSADFQVQPYTPPEVKEWHVDLEYPAYTEHPKAVQTTPDISIVRASTASFRITPNVKLSKARLRFNDSPSVEMTAGSDGFWTGSVKIVKDTDFWIELADEKGHPGGNETPFHIKALPDEAPKVEITEPGQDMRAEATNSIPVKISVTDDFGIGEVKLVYHRLGSPEEFVTEARKNETNTTMSASLPLTSMGLKEYEIVAYHAEAKDKNNLDGPGIGRSQVYFVEITSEEGSPGKKPGKPGQKANLLVIQKQIIADTVALQAKPKPEAFKDLALRQKDAIDFGKIYLSGMASVGAPTEASQEMEAALTDMAQAQSLLEKSDRDQALRPEESALARLYHILKLLPELKDLPTAPPKLADKPKDDKPQTPLMKVVLEAIKKKSKEQPDNKAIEEALQEAQQLEQQAGLVIGNQNPGNPNAKGQGADVKLDRSGKAAKAGDSDPKDSKETKEAKAGAGGKSGKEGKDGKEAKEGDPKENQKLAEKETELSKEAAALAEKLARLAGKDSRLGHGAAKKMAEAAGKMGGAAEATKAGDAQTAGTKGMQSDAAMNAAIALLERVLQNRPELADVANEDFPKEYEGAIADYLKQLSYAE